MSLKTDNFKLYKYEDNDIGDLRFINDSMDIIDKGINPFYVATKSSTNVYKITTGLNKTSLANGYSIKVAIPSNSTGAVSITVDSVTVPVKKPNGNAVTNFKQNGVYSLTYYNSVFILASGGVDDVNFTSDKLLTGYSANDSNGEKINGTMPNKGTSANTLGLNGSLTLPSGYYDSIKVTQSVTTKGSTTDAISQGVNGDYIYTRIPQGAYFTNASFGYPEIKSKFSDIAAAVGLTANKLVGNVGGINGTYKSINDIWAYTPGTITLPSTRENTAIVSIPFEPSIIIGFSMTETGKTYSATNPSGGDIRWGVGNGRFFKIMSGSYAFKHIDSTQNRTCIQDVTYSGSGGRLRIKSSGSYGGSDFRYTFMIVAIR